MSISNKPGFIIGGAPRCGTTWLYHLLEKHPEIFMAKPIQPEPKFFLVDDLYAHGINFYLSNWFSDIGNVKIAGEKSTNYLESAATAKRIQTHFPGIKLVFILREPAERAFSNFQWSRVNGLENEDFPKALELESEREKHLPDALRFSRPYAYYSRGLYANMLKPYFDLFSHDNILCLKYENIKDYPEHLAEQLHRFLGVEIRSIDSQNIGVINPSVVKPNKESIPDSIIKRLKERYTEPNARLAHLLGPDFEIWMN